jgi:hypothetical protein
MSSKPNPKKISRRDAIKLLGAVTGATVLANLPSKWKTPEITKGVLPVHAQTSNVVSFITCDANTSFQSSPFNGTIGLTISPGIPGIELNLLLLGGYNPLEQTVVVNGLPSNPISTGPGGIISIPITITVTPITANSGSLNFYWTFVDPAYSFLNCTQVISWSGLPIPMLPIVQTVSIIPSDPNFSPSATFNGNVISEGTSPIIAQGFVWDFDPNNNPSLSNQVIPFGGTLGVGPYTTGNVFVSDTTGDKFGRAYATNSVGTAYGEVLAFTTGLCLVEGTLVTMADGTSKRIEDIEYSDRLRVWNFDDCRFDEAEPFWIMKADTTQQYLVFEFSDGSELKSVVQHRIFNKEKGMFTYPMSEDAPIGTTTFNAKGEEVTLLGMRVVNEEVRFYNIITNRHMNLFANGILTSCRYNNIYPIVDMKFVKDDRVAIPQEAYGLEEKYYEGLRLAEQTIDIDQTIAYINRLKTHAVETELILA